MADDTTTRKGSSLLGLLNKARTVGILEEAFSVVGHDFVLQNLPPEAYTEIYSELSRVENEIEYMQVHQVEHVCRSIVEIDGEDLRGVKYIEVEEDDPKTPGHKISVKVPRHQWIRDILMAQWARPTVHTLFRKFSDITDEAEAKAREGVVFKVSDETVEEKFRRLMVEALAASSDLPDDMKEAILQEHGLVSATSTEELERMNEQAKRFLDEQRALQEAREAETSQAAEEAPVEEEPEPQEEEEVPEPVAVPPQILQALQQTPEELMAKRTPLNRTPIKAPVPKAQNVQVNVINKRPPPPAPDLIAPPLNTGASKRAAALAALEADASAGGVPLDGTGVQQVYRVHPESPVLETSIQDDYKPRKVPINPQPKGGVNKKFVDGTKSGLNPRRA